MLKYINYLIALYSLSVLIYLLVEITQVPKNVLRFYYYTLHSESLIIIFLLLYLIGSISNILSKKYASDILLCGVIGFLISALIDLIFIRSYSIEVTLVYIILNSIVFLVIDKNILRKRGPIYFVIAILLVYSTFKLLNVNLVL